MVGQTKGPWGIHKRDDGMFVLTHIPTGYLVTSSYKKRSLMQLTNLPEFSAGCWQMGGNPNAEDVERLRKTISHFFDENGWSI